MTIAEIVEMTITGVAEIDVGLVTGITTEKEREIGLLIADEKVVIVIVTRIFEPGETIPEIVSGALAKALLTQHRAVGEGIVVILWIIAK